MKIYLLSIGEYSDYRVIGIFDENHLEDAKRHAEYIGGDVSEEPLELNRFDRDEPPPGLKYFRVEMKRNGDGAVCCQDAVLDECEYKRRSERYLLCTAENTPYERRHCWRLCVCLYAESEEAAIKVSGELRAMILAGAMLPADPKKREWLPLHPREKIDTAERAGAVT